MLMEHQTNLNTCFYMTKIISKARKVNINNDDFALLLSDKGQIIYFVSRKTHWRQVLQRNY